MEYKPFNPLSYSPISIFNAQTPSATCYWEAYKQKPKYNFTSTYYLIFKTIAF